MGEDINQSGATRTNLLALQRTAASVARTQERVSTGLKVNSAVDDANAFFQARSLSDRIGDLAILRDEIGQGVRTIETAVQGIESITDLVNEMKGIALSAKSDNEAANRSKSAALFNDMRARLDNLANDASYKGTNLIKGSPANLRVTFSDDGGLLLTVPGIPSDASGLSIAATADNWGADTDINNAINDLDSALTTLQSTAAKLGTNASVLTLRLDFTENLINSLEEGAAKLGNADLNKESVNLPTLQPRQWRGAIGLSIGRQSGQSILRLF